MASSRSTVSTVKHAAAQAAGRGLSAALQRNPLAAVAAAVVTPLVGLINRRTAPVAVKRLKLERYSAIPCRPAGARSKDEARMNEGRTKEPRPQGVPVRAHRRAYPAVARKGGDYHG